MVLATAQTARAHEFWIDPLEYQVESGAALSAHFRNGETFKGTPLAYFDRRSTRLEVITQAARTPYAGRMGDIPAVQTRTNEDGLLIIAHETAPSTLTYATWEKFQTFADHKDFPDMRARHAARRLPDEGFTETYRRFAKALIAVGTGTGADIVTGMETEFVARSNPYTDDPARGMTVTLLYEGAPRRAAQVEIFERPPSGDVRVTLLRTDDDGTVTVPVKPGHTYLLDAVLLRPIHDGESVWESLWAALTFHVP